MRGPHSDLDLRGRRLAPEHAASRSEAFLAPRTRLRALVDPARAAELGERIRDLCAPALRTGREKLADGEVGVTIDDEPRQTVGLRKYEPARCVDAEHPELAARLDGSREPTMQKRRVYRLIRHARQNSTTVQ